MTWFEDLNVQLQVNKCLNHSFRIKLLFMTSPLFIPPLHPPYFIPPFPLHISQMFGHSKPFSCISIIGFCCVCIVLPPPPFIYSTAQFVFAALLSILNLRLLSHSPNPSPKTRQRPLRARPRLHLVRLSGADSGYLELPPAVCESVCVRATKTDAECVIRRRQSGAEETPQVCIRLILEEVMRALTHIQMFSRLYILTQYRHSSFLTFITYRRVNPHLCFSSVREEVLEVTSRVLKKKKPSWLTDMIKVDCASNNMIFFYSNWLFFQV